MQQRHTKTIDITDWQELKKAEGYCVRTNLDCDPRKILATMLLPLIPETPRFHFFSKLQDAVREHVAVYQKNKTCQNAHVVTPQTLHYAPILPMLYCMFKKEDSTTQTIVNAFDQREVKIEPRSRQIERGTKAEKNFRDQKADRSLDGCEVSYELMEPDSLLGNSGKVKHASCKQTLSLFTDLQDTSLTVNDLTISRLSFPFPTSSNSTKAEGQIPLENAMNVLQGQINRNHQKPLSGIPISIAEPSLIGSESIMKEQVQDVALMVHGIAESLHILHLIPIPHNAPFIISEVASFICAQNEKFSETCHGLFHSLNELIHYVHNRPNFFLGAEDELMREPYADLYKRFGELGFSHEFTEQFLEDLHHILLVIPSGAQSKKL